MAQNFPDIYEVRNCGKAITALLKAPRSAIFLELTTKTPVGEINRKKITRYVLSCIFGLNISTLHSKQHTQLNFMNDIVERIKQLQRLFVKNDARKGLIKPDLTFVFLRQLAMVVSNSKYSLV